MSPTPAETNRVPLVVSLDEPSVSLDEPSVSLDEPSISFDEPDETGRSSVGGKAAGLALAHRNGFSVPASRVLTVRAFESWLADDVDLQATVSDLLSRLAEARRAGLASVPALGQELRQAICDAELSPLVASALLEAARVVRGGEDFPIAVRSSGVDEDGAVFSRAGHYESFLDVRTDDDIVCAFKGCLASAFSPQAIAAGMISERVPSIAVIVQRQLTPSCAGILFTQDPLSGEPAMVIELASGTGTAIAAGTITPTRYVVRTDGGRVEDAARMCGDMHVGESFVQELVALGAALEALFGCPQDIEWAAEGETLYVLQTRAVTAVAQDRSRGDFWTSANSQEALARPVTPLTYSFMQPAIERGRLDLLETLGLPDHGTEYMRCFYGRVFFNADYFRRFIGELDVVPPELFDVLLFGDAHSIHFPVPKLSRRILRFGLHGLRTWWQARSRMDSFPPRIARFLSATAALDLSRLDKDELERLLVRTSTVLEYGLRLHVLGTAMAGGHYLLLTKLLDRLDVKNVQDELLVTHSEVETAGIGSALFGLARLATVDEAFAERIRQLDDDGVLELFRSGSSSAAACQQALESFLERFGHLSETEAELASPRWAEDPRYVVRVLRSFLGRCPGFLEPRHTREQRRSFRKRISSAIWNRASRFWHYPKATLTWLSFHLLLSWAERYAPYRENMRFHALKAYARVRAIALEVGRRLHEQGIIDGQDDIFFASYGELLAGLRTGEHWSTQAGCAVRRTIAERKRQHAKDCEAEAPRFVWSNGSPAVPPGQAQTLTPKKHLLSGTGVSGGVVRGRARIVGALDEALDLGPNDILVARLAPPAWTPAFFLVRAVVLDIGGMLSHCAVIAREHGIPCVVGVGNGTEVLREGDEVLVDAYSGKVYREPVR